MSVNELKKEEKERRRRGREGEEGGREGGGERLGEGGMGRGMEIEGGRGERVR